MKATKKPGRPTTKGTPGQKATLGIRATPELKERLDKAAKRNDRSLSQEAELRLERSFDRGALIDEVLQLAYGKPLAGLIRAIADGMHIVGSGVGFQYSGFQPHGRSDWTEIPYAYERARRVAVDILERARPAGKIIPDDLSPETKEAWEFFLEHPTADLIYIPDALRGRGKFPGQNELGEELRAALTKPMAERLAKET